MPVVLAVGGELEPNVLLQAHYAADRLMLDARQLGRWDLAFLRSLSRPDQRVRPDQAADMVGAERRFHSLLHGSYVQFLWSTMAPRFPRGRQAVFLVMPSV